MDKRKIKGASVKRGYALIAALCITAAVSVIAFTAMAIVTGYVNGTVDYSALRAAVYRG